MDKSESLTSTLTAMRLIRPGMGRRGWGVGGLYIPIATLSSPGFQARSKDLEILEEGGGAGPSTADLPRPAEIMSREVELPLSKFSGRLLLRAVQVVRQQQCNGHCLSDSVQHSS